MSEVRKEVFLKQNHWPSPEKEDILLKESFKASVGFNRSACQGVEQRLKPPPTTRLERWNWWGCVKQQFVFPEPTI